jgi:hypothetical protein
MGETSLWRRVLALLLVPLFILAVAAWHSRPEPLLRVIFLNTPGDAVLLVAPDGSATLIDGGRDPAMLALLLGQELPFYERDLHALVLTSPTSSRLPGQVAALARYRPGLILAPPAMSAKGTSGEWLRLIDELHVPVRTAAPGMKLSLAPGVTMEVVGVATGDDGGMLLRIAYGSTSALLHMGGPALDAQALASARRPATLLAYPWQREPDEALIQRLRPQVIVFSDGYSVDEPALLSYADRAYNSAQIYHEKNEGTVTLVSDGQRAWVEVE